MICNLNSMENKIEAECSTGCLIPVWSMFVGYTVRLSSSSLMDFGSQDRKVKAVLEFTFGAKKPDRERCNEMLRSVELRRSSITSSSATAKNKRGTVVAIRIKELN